MPVSPKKIDSFLGKLNCGADFLREAGQCLVAMLDEDSQAFDAILRESPAWVTRDVLHTIEAIGRGQVVPEAIILPSFIYKRLALLTPAQQMELLSAPIEVAGLRSSGHHTTLKELSKLTCGEAARAIGPNGARTLEEQRAIMQPDKSLGCWQIAVMNGKPFLKKCEPSPTAKVIKLVNGQVVVEFRL